MSHKLFNLLAFLLIVFTARAVEPSGTLPVLYINTNGGAPILNKTDYVKATYWLDPMGDTSIEAIGSSEAPQELQIRGRGNYTWSSFDKKPYRLKLGKKQPLMGMNKNKHWALLAHADDSRAFLRNTVGFQLSRLVGLPWTPGDKPLEVVLNGDYIGLYFLTETVRVDKDRVDVWDYDSEYEDYADAHPGETLPWQDIYNTGGWLVEIDNYDDDDQIVFNSVDPYVPDKTMRITYDTPSDYITDSQIEWLRDEMTTLDRLICEGNKQDMLWAEKVDLTNAARFFVVNQIVFNCEAYHGSCKLSRQQGYDTKWNYGPVWDFGSAFQSIDNKLLFDYGPYSNHWIKAMYQYPGFVEEVERVYATLMETDYATLDSYIDTFIQHIKSAAARDLQRWPQYGNDNLEQRAAEVKQMLAQSVSFLNYTWHYADDPYIIEPLTDIYLRGSINNWDAPEAYKFINQGDYIYTLHLDHLEGEFKLAGPQWGHGNVDFGSGGVVEPDTPVVLLPAGGNCKLEAPLDDVTLTFDWTTKELTLTTGTPVAKPTVYFIDDKQNQWEQVYVFTWLPQICGAWPGAEMTRVDASEINYPESTIVWKYVFNGSQKPVDGQTGIIFGDGGSQGEHQTADLIYTNGGIYNYDGLLTGISDICTEPVEAEYYNLQGVRIANPTPGIYIVRRGSTVTRELIR